MPHADPGGVYLHIPFCAAICHYCNFNRGPDQEPLRRRYVEALISEIARAPQRGAPVDTVYFGGGTPSLLPVDDVARILAACRATFDLAPSAEVTLEANPESVTDRTLAGYRSAGVNRLSLGVQSFHDADLVRLGRRHGAAEARAAVGMARRAGFDNVSVDLMTWLPGQSVDDWRHSVDALVELAPDHASVYLLELYPNAPLKDVMIRDRLTLAPEDEAAEMYLDGLSRLEAAGYAQYEISNLARPGFHSRHNLKYWQEGNWVGFGCGAHSTWHGARWRNRPSTVDYIERLSAGAPVELDRRELSRQERIEEALFMGLRLTEGLDLDRMRTVHGIDVWETFKTELGPAVEAGLLAHTGTRLVLTRPGMLLANEIMAVFISGRVR